MDLVKSLLIRSLTGFDHFTRDREEIQQVPQISPARQESGRCEEFPDHDAADVYTAFRDSTMAAVEKKPACTGFECWEVSLCLGG